MTVDLKLLYNDGGIHEILLACRNKNIDLYYEHSLDEPIVNKVPLLDNVDEDLTEKIFADVSQEGLGGGNVTEEDQVGGANVTEEETVEEVQCDENVSDDDQYIDVQVNLIMFSRGTIFSNMHN